MNLDLRPVRLLHQPWFAYCALVLLQLKVVWRIWDYKDLPIGDTADYFLDAYQWYSAQLTNIVWSPLYTTFLGSLLHTTSDVYAVMTLHRLMIVFSVSLLVLAVMRRLLPHGIAWCIAAWWVILPINFDTFYEVHLFSVIPTLVASLLVLYQSNRWGRGGAIAILAGASILVRNELFVATLMLVVFCLMAEVWQRRTTQIPIHRYGLAYGLPLLGAGLVVAYFYQHSWLKLSNPDLLSSLRFKHTLNVCQIYAVGYHQRHPEWTGNSWTGCQALMNQTFGQPLPTLTEAFWANPAAILEHLGWNMGLALNGVQISLFNATSGSMNPDYVAVQLNMAWVILPTLVVGGLLMGGAIMLYRERHYWWQTWLRQRIWGWAVLASVAAVSAFVVLPMQRPRPSYLFSLAVLLMAATGMCLVIVSRHGRIGHVTKWLAPMLAIALLIGVQPYYQPRDRYGLDLYLTFRPFQTLMGQAGTVLLYPYGPDETCYYFKRFNPSIPGDPIQKFQKCQAVVYGSTDFFAGVPMQTSLTQRLQEQHVNLFYADAALLDWLKSNPKTQEFITHPEAQGWRIAAQQQVSPAKRWILFQTVADTSKP
jgi:uncharacterized membrane protein SirB2